MTIETLKALKDAGFRQSGEGRTIYRGGAHEPMYVPTMEELIESFGDVQITLTPNYYTSRIIGADSTAETWTVCGRHSCAIGDTRTEALANLYIYINN